MKTARINSFLWALFGAGGFLSAFVYPVLALLFLLALGFGEFSIFNYYWMSDFLSNPLNKLVLLGLIVLPVWHAAFRIFHSLHDFGIHAGISYKILIYGGAVAISLISTFFLFVS